MMVKSTFHTSSRVLCWRQAPELEENAAERLPSVSRFAFTLLELLVVIGIIGVLFALLIPAVGRTSREAARRMACSNSLRQISIALSVYHDRESVFPSAMGGTFQSDSDVAGVGEQGNNGYRLSCFVALLPMLDHQRLWDEIASGQVRQTESGLNLDWIRFSEPASKFSPMGPAPWSRAFPPWQTELSVLRCPSDPGVGLPGHGRTNYAACLGDAMHWVNTGPVRFDISRGQWVADRSNQIAASGRGAFVPRRFMSKQDMVDGLSSTVLIGEIATDLGDGDKRTLPHLDNDYSAILTNVRVCSDDLDDQRSAFWSEASQATLASQRFADERRGFRWADGAALYTGCHTMLPPNAELCGAGGDSGIGTHAVSSRHAGGVHVAFADASVKFLTESIDAGQRDSALEAVWVRGQGTAAPGSPSPFGLWGALGTRANRETVEEPF